MKSLLIDDAVDYNAIQRSKVSHNALPLFRRIIFFSEKHSLHRRFTAFTEKYSFIFFSAFFICLFFNGAVFADAEDLWNTVADLIGKWVLRLGGVVIFIGGILFGLGWKNDDAEGKSRGISTMISGGIVAALAVMVDQFFV